MSRPKKPKPTQGDATTEGAATTTISFAEAAQAQSPHEVCRMFLAALQLSNWRNLDLQPSGSIETGDLELDLHLLNKERRRIELEYEGA